MQLMLFAELPVPEDAAEQLARRSRICVPWRVAVSVLRLIGKRRPRLPTEHEQIPLRIVLREPERDDVPEPMPVHRLVSAADAEPLRPTGFSSVFGMADAAKASKALRQHGRFGAASGFEPAPYRVEREFGRVRVVRLQVQDTEEWQERERVRRAKQRPPKPTAKAKTRGKKVRRWDGEEHDD